MLKYHNIIYKGGVEGVVNKKKIKNSINPTSKYYNISYRGGVEGIRKKRKLEPHQTRLLSTVKHLFIVYSYSVTFSSFSYFPPGFRLGVALLVLI